MFTRCFFGHDWSKWEKYENRYKFAPGITAPSEIQGKWFDTFELRQSRRCQKCGRHEDELIRKSL